MLKTSMFMVVAAALGILASGPSLAQTADGQTPATETVCNSLLGGTPGLHGLCVAYCEAQDLDDMLQQAKAEGNPGGKILARYRAKMQAGDPDMPCIVSATTCPCFNVNVCDADPGSIQCTLQILSVGDLFAGLSCDNQDSCQNAPGIAADVCASSGEVEPTSANIRTLPEVGICFSSTPNPAGGFLINGVIMDLATTQICLDELNTYDGNGENDPDVLARIIHHADGPTFSHT